MNYYESAEGVEITRKRALHELKRHHVAGDVRLFDEEVKPNNDGLYDAQAVLGWLGY